MSTQRMCYDYPMRYNEEYPFITQVVVPRDMTTAEANRICAFILTLAQPSPGEGEEK